MKFCTHCGKAVSDADAFCPFCGERQKTPEELAQEQAAARPNAGPDPAAQSAPGHASAPAGNGGLWHRFMEHLTRLAGGEGAVRPPLKTVFGGIFKRHDRKEGEEIFISGTEKTTPPLTAGSVSWPQPWLFSRVFLGCVIALLALVLCWEVFENINAVPGIILIGSFMMPIALFVFFYELNTPKNISFFTVMKVFLIGGCASLLFTLFLFEFVAASSEVAWAILVGIVEEIGKLVIVWVFLYTEKKADCCLNGLVIGAAVGAGFAAFESAGYAFQFLLASGDTDVMLEVILVRGFLAPGGHIVWAAMSGYAMMLAKGDQPFSLDVFKQGAFWKLFWIPVALHALWDMPIPSPFYLVQILLTLASWVVILVMIGNSLGQIGKRLQAGGPITPDPVAPSVPSPGTYWQPKP